MKRKFETNGFHLIEILIALAIISLTTHWMIVSYQPTIAIAHRNEAKIALFKLAAALEEYALVNDSYTNATLDKLQQPLLVAKKNYRLNIDHVDQQTFIISATPLAKQAAADTQCGALSLTAEGEKHASGNKSWNKCW